MLTFTMPLGGMPLTKAFQGHLAFPPRGNKGRNLTIIQIRQLKRSYSRRLKFGTAFYVFQYHYTTCLLSTKSCCQNQSTPVNFQPNLIRLKGGKDTNLPLVLYVASNCVPIKHLDRMSSLVIGLVESLVQSIFDVFDTYLHENWNYKRAEITP